MEKIGHLPPFGLRMPSALKMWLTEQAKRADRSLNYTIVSILTDRMQAATGDKIGVQAPAAAGSHSDALQGVGQFHP